MLEMAILSFSEANAKSEDICKAFIFSYSLRSWDKI